jgi:arylsulfatase A-like enzyme
VVYHTALGYDEPPYDANNPILRGGQPVEEDAYLTDAFTREAVSFIERHRAEPFFLQVSYNAVHSPMQGANIYMEKFKGIEDIQRRIFAAMLANMDSSVGAIMQMLKDCGLEENTLVIFFSDNGGPTLELTSSNAPLRGGKGTMFEGGLRIPFMLQWKNRLHGGLTYGHAVSSLDLFPTCAAAAGANIPDNLDGVDLLPFLSGEKKEAPHEILFWRQGARTALRKGDWKIFFNPQSKSWELYNLAEDLAEKDNLSARFPEKAAELIDDWEKLNEQMIEPLF